ncbi:hypothetical protein BT96DRAFT_474644 [Gymnopus androsaceus JB14]|uniref:Secreted protein n=1 Tax=Gymnopus androsaceus JB14 TaxID=1447944 RepID=A0A6A4I4Q2_9AGAR|nr:hypothetical protein BT96DRAFT_474644 [Gymnopus androsaceus JB14]
MLQSRQALVFLVLTAVRGLYPSIGTIQSVIWKNHFITSRSRLFAVAVGKLHCGSKCQTLVLVFCLLQDFD